MEASAWIPIVEKYLLAVICILCVIIGFWMGRRTRGEKIPMPGADLSLRSYLKRDPEPEPEEDIFNDALGSAEDDLEKRAKIPTITGDGRV